MKSIVCASLVLALAAVCQAQQPTSARDEIVKLEQQLTDAGNRGDVSVAEKYLAANYEVTSITGTIANREQALGSIRKHQQQNTIRNIKVRLLGNGAVATYESTVSDNNPKTGAPETRKLVESDFWVKRNGQWLLLASQGSPAEPLPPEMWQQSSSVSQ
jgi:hypothetical protein